MLFVNLHKKKLKLQGFSEIFAEVPKCPNFPWIYLSQIAYVTYKKNHILLFFRVNKRFSVYLAQYLCLSNTDLGKKSYGYQVPAR